MSETPETTPPRQRYDFTDDPDGITRDDFVEQDELLDILLSVLLKDRANEPDDDSNFGLTVSVNGTVVSGLAVSRASWFKLMTATIRPHASTIAEGLEAALPPIWDEQATFVQRREDAGLPTPQPRYIHLKDAVILSGNVRQQIGLWRARRTSIDGWTLAQIQP